MPRVYEYCYYYILTCITDDNIKALKVLLKNGLKRNDAINDFVVKAKEDKNLIQL